MATNVVKGVITAPGSTGQQTYSLPANTDPFNLIVWMTYETADGAFDGDGRFTFGSASYDGAAVQQRYMHGNDTDALGTGAVGRMGSSTSLLRGALSGTTVDFEVDFISFQTGASSNFVLDWVDLPSTGSILVHYIVIGGSAPEVTRARVGSFTATTAVATQDVTITAGYGQPDLLIFFGRLGTNEADNTGAERLLLGAAKSDTERRASVYACNGGATMVVASWQKARAAMALDAGVLADFEMDLSSKASWPTDGFQVSYPDQAGLAQFVGYIAIKGSLPVTIGSTTVPTAAAPQVQNLALASGTPKGALLWGTGVATNAGIDTTHADLGEFWVGGMDGTNEGMAAAVQDDLNSTSRTGRAFSQTKAAAHHVADALGGAPTLASEADGTISGSNVVLTWNDTDTVAREFNYLIFGEATAATKAFPFLSRVARNPLLRR